MLFRSSQSTDRVLYAFETATGATSFNRTLAQYEGKCLAPPSTGGNDVAIMTSDDALVGIDTASDGATLWTHPGQLNAAKGIFRSSTDPANIIYAADVDGTFMAVDATTGASLWNYSGAANWGGNDRPVLSPDETVWTTSRCTTPPPSSPCELPTERSCGRTLSTSNTASPDSQCRPTETPCLLALISRACYRRSEEHTSELQSHV